MILGLGLMLAWIMSYSFYTELYMLFICFEIDMVVKIDPTWWEHLQEEFEKPYMKSLREELLLQKKQWIEIYPAGPDMFNAFNSTPFDTVKVIILGQDPYHGPWQAHGLSFSVPEWVTPPPSLKNIFKELVQSWLIEEAPRSGNLSRRADQGVFLLNAMLTVKANQAWSHQSLGWQQFTDTVISLLSQKKTWLVFLLWWNFAQSKLSLIDQTKHHVLCAPHPSPLSAHRGFLGSNCFVECNQLLEKQGKTAIFR